MASPTINLRDLVVLIADSSSYLSMIAHGILRGFGTNKVLEVRNSLSVLQALSGQKIDILLCDARLPPHGEKLMVVLVDGHIGAAGMCAQQRRRALARLLRVVSELPRGPSGKVQRLKLLDLVEKA